MEFQDDRCLGTGVTSPAWHVGRVLVRSSRTGAGVGGESRMSGLGRAIVIVTAAAASALVAVTTWDVLTHAGLARYDRSALVVVTGHRTAWLTSCMQAVTWLGSNAVLAPLLVAAGVVLLWHRRAIGATLGMWVGYGGAVISYTVMKRLVDRPRPPAQDALMHVTGAAFPSGHATQAVAAWGGLALVLVAVVPRHRSPVLAGAAAIVLLVGASRVYLGVHWPTDVLAGYAVGGTWLLTVLALHPPYAARPSCRHGRSTVDHGGRG